jgi:hypothetical protein
MRRGILWCAVAVMAMAAGCKDENNPVDAYAEYVFPKSNVSFTQHVQPLFRAACAISGCHGYGSQSSALRLNEYVDVRDATLLVVIPGNAQDSRIVMRIEGRIQPQMPYNRTALNQNQINGIRAWINEGANFN